MQKSYYLLMLYSVIAIVFIMSFLLYPQMLKRKQINYLNQAKQQIQETIEQKTGAELLSALENIRKEYPLEIVVYKELHPSQYETIIQTLPGVEFNDLRNILQAANVLAEWQGEISGKGANYLCWYSIYQPNLQQNFNMMFIIQTTLIGLTSILLISLFMVLQKQLMAPLNQLKDSVYKLNHFELESIENNVENDVINQDVASFANRLSRQMKVLTKNYTALEYELQLEKQRLRNLMDISRGLVHDLKTPMHKIMLENDLALQRFELTKEAKMIANYNIRRIEAVMLKINDILKMMNTNMNVKVEADETFDVIALFNNISQGFNVLLDSREMMIFSNLEERINIVSNRVIFYLIIHNTLSNAIKYALNKTDIEVSIYTEDNFVYIKCSNVASLLNIERMSMSENIFVAADEEAVLEKGKEHRYSSGNGLYLIKELTNSLNGTYNFSANATGNISGTIEITLTIPLKRSKGGDNNAM